MNVLVINSGSSSIKAEVIDTLTETRRLVVRIERILEASPQLYFSGEDTSLSCPASGHEACLKYALPLLINKLGEDSIDAIGHRVVHGGKKFNEPTKITTEVEASIKQLFSLAPLHNPANLKGIQVAQEIFPNQEHVAVFDTAFHHTLPKRAYHYALPKALREKHDLRRYGFHGTSHQYIAEQAAKYLGCPLQKLRLISCHLGNGASVAAIEYGRSVETSMGLTPLEGLVMGTRSGDIDPGVLFQIAREEQLDIDALDQILNKESGLKGLSDKSNDMRDIIDKAAEGDEDCRLALVVFTHRLRKYIGAYAAIMGGVDAILFTGGIGENSAVVRHRACQRLEFLGAMLDEDKNHDLKLSVQNAVVQFSTENSLVKLMAIRTDEQLAIAQSTAKVVESTSKVNTIPTIPIAVSARHIHLTQDTIDILFGKGYQLTEKAPLSQPGQFAANERVTLIGPKNQLERVRILGPTRSKNQIEISRTDEFFLGIDAPVRASGKVENTPGIKLVGPKGAVTLKEGVICAWRHIHMTPQDAAVFGVQDKDVVEVQVVGGDRPLTFGNVLVRVSPKYALEMHIDTDEANAAELPSRSEGVLAITEGQAKLVKRRID